jgi:aspartyl protease family protein
MRHILIFAILMVVLAAAVPKLVPRHDAADGAETAQPQTASNTPAIAIRRGQNGHFETDAVLDGRRMSFLIDTGATVIALRESDAARLGIHPGQRDYSMKISTANGVTLAAPVEINRVEVGDVTVRNVAALVLPDQALAQNLLGMSFLSRVHWQYESNRLVLQQ